MCHKELSWRVQPEKTPTSNSGVSYNVRKVNESEVMEFVPK